MKLSNKQGWFIFGLILFTFSIGYLFGNYDNINSLNNLEQAKIGIPLALSIFGGAWMMSQIRQ